MEKGEDDFLSRCLLVGNSDDQEQRETVASKLALSTLRPQTRGTYLTHIGKDGSALEIDDLRAVADALYASDDYVGALEWYQRLQKKAGRSCGLRREMMDAQLRCLRTLNRHSDVLALAEEIISDLPGGADGYSILSVKASAHEALGHLEDAQALFEQCVRLRPSLWASWADLALIYDKIGGMNGEAVTCAKRAMWLVQGQESFSIAKIIQQIALLSTQRTPPESHLSQRYAVETTPTCRNFIEPQN